ncbi:hypothetical protein Tco_0593740 [Tanacetum coccineum]
MAIHFGQTDIHGMEQPVIIAISSCRVSKYTDYQLFASSATYYYLNPKIPKAKESRDLFKARYEDSPPLTICKTPHKDVQQDKTRNKFSLKTIMDQNLQSYRGVRFTAKETIIGINMNKDWYYISCHQCGKAAITNGDDHSCLDHGPQPGPFFRTGREIQATDPAKIPPEILSAQGKHGIFQFHFNTLGNLTDLSLDAVYDVQSQDHSTSSSTQETNKGTASSASTATNQLTEEEENTHKDKEKCTAKEGEVTPPPTQSTVTGAKKNNEQSDRPQGTSAKRALFDQQSIESKKHKED